MKNQTLIILAIFILIGCSVQKTSIPLEKLDFKNHNWQIVYAEHISSDTLKSLPDIWLLNDNRIIDSLKNEYSCKINHQGDGENEYEIYFFKDKEFSDWNIFNDKKYFVLGSIKSKLIPVNTSYYYFPNLFLTKVFTDSLDRNNSMYTISPIRKEKTDTYGIEINLFMNLKSKLIKSKDPGFYDCREYAKEELARLYPEFYNSNISFIEKEQEPKWYPGAQAPGDMIGPTGNFNYTRNEQKIFISSNKPFVFDTSKFSQTDLFSRIEICTQYTVTIYTKK